MTNASLRLLGLGFALVACAGPARAWWFEDDGRSWPVFAFHEYDGSDVNRPGGTPDRPYWHGDDAVPLGMRWHDLAAARAEGLRPRVPLRRQPCRSPACRSRVGGPAGMTRGCIGFPASARRHPWRHADAASRQNAGCPTHRAVPD